MSTNANELAKPTDDSPDLKTHKVDVVASILMAGLLVIGFLVFLMFIIWLTETWKWDAGTIILTENPAGRGDHAEGFERDIEPPGAEEFEELQEPTLAETLEAVTDVATTVAASLDSINSNSTASTSGNGRGDSRPPGPLGEGDDIIPRAERWELKFLAKGQAPYAKQLDYYKIELGAMGGGIPTIDIASNLSRGGVKRSTTPQEENKKGRLIFMWRQKNQLQQYDVALLKGAGIKTSGRSIFRLLPKDLENQMALTEKAYWESKGYNSVTQIAKTVFESRPDGRGGYSFVVISQRYRVPKKSS